MHPSPCDRLPVSYHHPIAFPYPTTTLRSPSRILPPPDRHDWPRLAARALAASAARRRRRRTSPHGRRVARNMRTLGESRIDERAACLLPPVLSPVAEPRMIGLRSGRNDGGLRPAADGRSRESTRHDDSTSALRGRDGEARGVEDRRGPGGVLTLAVT